MEIKCLGRLGRLFVITKTLPALMAAVVMFIVLSCSQDDETIKIGAIIPLTGSASQHAVVVDGMRLAVNEINKYGGINNRKMELIVVDSKTEPEVAKNALLKTENEQHPLLYISTTSVVSRALAPLVEEKRVVLASIVDSNPFLTKNRKWVFRYYAGPREETMPILNILQKLDVKTLDILYQDDPFGCALYEFMKKSFEKTGGIVINHAFAPKAPDFEKTINSVKKSEAIYIVGFVKLVGAAITQLHRVDFKGHILVHSGASSLLNTIPALDNVYIAAPIIYNPNYVYANHAKESYVTEFHNAFTHQAANGYDLIKLIAGLLEGQTLSRDNIRRLLNDEFSYPGIFGFIDKQKGAHDITFPLYPARIVSGKIEYLK